MTPDDDVKALRITAWLMVGSTVFMTVSAIGGGSWSAAFFAGIAAWFAWCRYWDRKAVAAAMKGD